MNRSRRYEQKFLNEGYLSNDDWRKRLEKSNSLTDFNDRILNDTNGGDWPRALYDNPYSNVKIELTNPEFDWLKENHPLKGSHCSIKTKKKISDKLKIAVKEGRVKVDNFKGHFHSQISKDKQSWQSLEIE